MSFCRLNYGVAGRPRMSLVLELLRFLGSRKKFWLIPLVILTLLFGALVVLTQSSAAAPFIYTIFSAAVAALEFLSHENSGNIGVLPR